MTDFLDQLDVVLPYYVDYLAALDHDEAEGITDCGSAVVHLVKNGIQKNVFVRDAEMTFTERGIVLRRSGVDRGVIKVFQLAAVRNPVAFTNRKSPGSAFNRLVVFSESGAGHFNKNDVYHMFQCVDGEPEDIVEQISKQIWFRRQSVASTTSSRRGRRSSSPSAASVSTFTGTDSVRSATVRQRPRSQLIMYDHDSPNSTMSRKSIPVSTPKAPSDRKEDNGQTVDRAVRKESNVYPFPLVSRLTKTNLGLDKPSIKYHTTDNVYDKCVILLNYCIEDIEKFTSDVKNFDRDLRQRYPDKAKKILAEKESKYRATDFVSTFQKFKLTFNLLGKLNGHISNPGAPELLLHLFPPMAILLDESHELFDVDLIRDISTPLPTRKGVDFMYDNLQDRELDIWKELGDYWLNPKSDWEGDIIPFQPRFSDGWSPGIVELSDDEDNEDSESTLSEGSVIEVQPVIVPMRQKSQESNGHKSLAKQESTDSKHSRRSHDHRSVQNGHADTPPVVKRASNQFQADNMSLASSIFAIAKEQEDFRDQLMDRGCSIALVTNTWRAKDPAQVDVFKKEHLEILDGTRNWWFCRTIDGSEGYVPCTYLRKLTYEVATPLVKPKQEQKLEKKPSKKKSPKQTRTSLPQHQANRIQRSEQEITITSLSNESAESDHGVHVQPQVIPIAPKYVELTTVRRNSSSSLTSVASSVPPPPPPPPAKIWVDPDPPIKQLQVQKKKNRETVDSHASIRSASSTMSVQQELVSVLEIFKEREKSLQITVTPEVFISKSSSPEEVKQWLKDKKFSETVITQLKGVNGKQLLLMKRSELISVFGKEVGGRLDGQLTISKKTTGFGTASSELKDILKKHRNRMGEVDSDNNGQGASP